MPRYRSTRNAPARLPMRSIDYIGIGLVLVYVWRIQDLFPILAKVQVPILLSLGALGMWVMGGFAASAQERYRHPAVKAAIFILVWMILSVPGSVYQGLSFRFIIDDHLKTFLVMLVLVSTARGVADIERLALANVVGASIYCLKILTTFSIGADGRLGNLYYYDANDLAMFIVATLPFTVYFVVRGTRVSHRLVALGAAGLLLLSIVKTGSRGGFLGLIAVSLFLLFGFRAIKARVRASAVVGGFLALMVFAGPRYWDMMATMLHPESDYNWSGQSDTGRMDIWKRGLGYMMARPVFGVGANAFSTAEGKISPLASRQQRGIGLKWSAAHNSFVQVGAELGVPGLVGFLLMLWGIARSNRAVTKITVQRGRWSNEASLAQAMNGSLVGYAVSGFFLSQGYCAFLYILCAMTVGLSVTQGGGDVGPRPERRLYGPRRSQGRTGRTGPRGVAVPILRNELLDHMGD